MLKYPSLESLHRVSEILSVKEVIAVEKLHGTNFRFCFPTGMTSIDEITYGSRNEEFGTGDNGSFYGGKCVAWCKDRPGLLTDLWSHFKEMMKSDVLPTDVTVYGEMCGSSIQKGVQYAPPGEVIFRAFSIRLGENFIHSYDKFIKVCQAVGLPSAPEVWRGPPSLEAFNALLDKPSFEAMINGIEIPNNYAEGVVIQSNPLLMTMHGQILMIKHKSNKFKETFETKTPTVKTGNKDAAQVFVMSVITPGRIHNAIGRLRDTNTPIQGGMEDMRYLAPCMLEDVKKECDPEWQDTIKLGATDSQIRKQVQHVVANVYREMLNEGAVNEC